MAGSYYYAFFVNIFAPVMDFVKLVEMDIICPRDYQDCSFYHLNCLSKYIAMCYDFH